MTGWLADRSLLNSWRFQLPFYMTRWDTGLLSLTHPSGPKRSERSNASNTGNQISRAGQDLNRQHFEARGVMPILFRRVRDEMRGYLKVFACPNTGLQ